MEYPDPAARSRGLAIGAIYGLIAMGFAVIYKATGLVNFAQGEMIMLTAYVAWTHLDHASAALSFCRADGRRHPRSPSCSASLIERVVMRPMLGEPVFATVMVTIGLAVILRSSINLIWGADPHDLDRRLSAATSSGSARSACGPAQLCAHRALWPLLVAAIWAVLPLQRIGIAMRAVAANETARRC